MAKTDKEDRKSFRVAYDMLPAFSQEHLKKSVCKKCGWSDQLFDKHKKGERILSFWEEENVRVAFQLMNLDAFTGKKLLKEIEAGIG